MIIKDSVERFVAIRFTPEEISVLTKLFSNLRDENILYAVLRGHKLLPECSIGTGTGDVDILIYHRQYPRAIALAHEAGLKQLERDRALSRLTTLALKGLIYPHKSIKWFTTHKLADLKTVGRLAGHIMDAKYTEFQFGELGLDLWEHLGHKSMMNGRYRRIDQVVEDDMLASRMLQKNLFYTLSPPHELAHLVNRIVLDKEGDVPEYYRLTMEQLVCQVQQEDRFLRHFDWILAHIYFKAANLVREKVFTKQFNTIRISLLTYQDY